MKTDMQLHQDVLAELTSDPRLYDCGQVIGVGANHGVVTLGGSVPSHLDKGAAERAVERVAGVSAVINKLTVNTPSDGLAPPDAGVALRNVDGVAWDGEVPENEVAESDVSQTIKEALERRADRTASHIIVDAKAGVVSLTGNVPSFADRRVAETAAPAEGHHQRCNMQTRIGVSYVAAIILAGTMVACGPSAAASRRADSAVAAAAKAHVIIQAGEVLSARREAQVFLDSARVSFVGKRRAAAAKGLREAASFTRQQSESAAGLDKEALAKSAKELERVATGVSTGAVKSVRTLDLAIARMQLSEAQFHYSRMMAAWNKNDAGVAGAELTMAIDHFDRGVGSAGVRLAPETYAAANEVHALATEMTSGAILTAADVEKTLTTFDNELQRVATVVSKKK